MKKANNNKNILNKPKNANEICVGPTSEQAGKASSCRGCPNQKICSENKNKIDNSSFEVSKCLKDVKHKLIVLSGKGGVGKSTFATNLAWMLSSTSNKQVGILDIDICGPSIPRMFSVENENVHRSNFGWTPIYVRDNLAVMSVGFMLNNKNDAVIWRGPRKNGLIKQFLTDVIWGELDYLIIDTPPGTSDEHISIAKLLKESQIDGAIIITTPQEVSLLDVRKEITFCKKVGIKIIGVVENMSIFYCPHCKKSSEIFIPQNGEGAKGMCKEMSLKYLGSIPINIELLKCCENGSCFFDKNKNSNTSKVLYTIKDVILDTIIEKNIENV